MKQGHELGNGGQRTPLLESTTPNQRVFAHRACIDLVRHLLAPDRTDRHVVDRNVPLGNLSRACLWCVCSGRNRWRQPRMLPLPRCHRWCRRQLARDGGRPSGRNGRWTPAWRSRWTPTARGRRFVLKRGHRLGPSGHIVEPVGRTGWNRNVCVDQPAVDQDLVIAPSTGKAHHAAPDLVIRDLVLGLTAIALESHRVHRLWAKTLTCAVSSFSSTEL